MKGYGSLFERLAGTAASRAGDNRQRSAEASLAAHLSRMLSTRAGSVQTLPGYGLPDFNDVRLSSHEVLIRARADIERFIEACEPRLSAVRVTPLPGHTDAFRLAFSIEGVLQLKGARWSVNLNARLDGGGQVEVSP